MAAARLQPRRDMLAAPSLGIDQDAHRPREGRALPGAPAVVHMPSVEQLDDLTAVRIVGFDDVNPLDRIATTKRQKWVTAPFGPLFKAAERATRRELGRVLPAPAPDRQRRRQEFGSP